MVVTRSKDIFDGFTDRFLLDFYSVFLKCIFSSASFGMGGRNYIVYLTPLIKFDSCFY